MRPPTTSIFSPRSTTARSKGGCGLRDETFQGKEVHGNRLRVKGTEEGERGLKEGRELRDERVDKREDVLKQIVLGFAVFRLPG